MNFGTNNLLVKGYMSTIFTEASESRTAIFERRRPERELKRCRYKFA